MCVICHPIELLSHCALQLLLVAYSCLQRLRAIPVGLYHFPEIVLQQKELRVWWESSSFADPVRNRIG